MYYDFTVRIPAEKGKIITRKKGRSTYILFSMAKMNILGEIPSAVR